MFVSRRPLHRKLLFFAERKTLIQLKQKISRKANKTIFPTGRQFLTTFRLMKKKQQNVAGRYNKISRPRVSFWRPVAQKYLPQIARNFLWKEITVKVNRSSLHFRHRIFQQNKIRKFNWGQSNLNNRFMWRRCYCSNLYGDFSDLIPSQTSALELFSFKIEAGVSSARKFIIELNKRCRAKLENAICELILVGWLLTAT